MTLEEGQNGPIRFGQFTLKPASGELYKDEELLKLPPQPYKVLLHLIQNAGELVTRKHLQEEIWGNDTFVDFDKGLNLCIAQIRESLGDDAQSPRYVETLPRRGYRFIGRIEEAESGEIVTPPTKIDESPGERSSTLRARRSRLLIVAVSLALLASVSVATLRYFRVSPNERVAAKANLLVLPFESLTNDPEQEYFSNGLTEEMIARLGSLNPARLGVIARTTALTYKDTKKDIRQIADELGVNYVLEGSIRREGGRLRITSQLIRADDQTHLWAETFDREESDILDIQREVAMRIASSLSIELSLTSSSDAVARKRAKPKAYDAYLKGRYLIAKDTPEDLRRSLPFFEQAVAEDPDFAPAYAAQVEALVLLTDWTGSIAIEDVPKAKAAALKAVQVDPSYAEGYAALGSVQLWLEWNRSDAETNLRRATELNPYNPLTRLNYGRCLLSKGQTESAILEINEAIKLDPVSLLTIGLASFANLHAGRYDEAIKLSERMLELEPKSEAARESLFRAYLNKRDYARALEITRERMKNWGEDPDELLLLDQGEPQAVLETRIRKSLEEMQGSKEKGERVWPLYGAWFAVLDGKKDLAFEWLERAFEEKATFLLYLSVDPVWEPLRSDPRFGQLIKRL